MFETLGKIELWSGETFEDFLKNSEEDFENLNLLSALVYIFLDAGEKYFSLGEMLYTKIDEADILFFDDEESIREFRDLLEFISYVEKSGVKVFHSDLNTFSTEVRDLCKFFEKHKLVENGKAFITVIKSFVYNNRRGNEEITVDLEEKLDHLFEIKKGRVIWNIPVIKAYSIYSDDGKHLYKNCMPALLSGVCFPNQEYVGYKHACCEKVYPKIEGYETLGQRVNSIIRKEHNDWINKLEKKGYSESVMGSKDDEESVESYINETSGELEESERRWIKSKIKEKAGIDLELETKSQAESETSGGTGGNYKLGGDWDNIYTGWARAEIQKSDGTMVVSVFYDTASLGKEPAFNITFHPGAMISQSEESTEDKRITWQSLKKVNDILKWHRQDFELKGPA